MEFQEALMGQACLKAGILGFAGGGKTWTAANIAIGLHDYIKSEKPIGFFETQEIGSDFLIPSLFQPANKKMVRVKSRAFVDLLDITKKAAKTTDILIIDSITHVHNELLAAYKKKMNRTRFRVQDWAPIKEEWSQFTEIYLGTRLHIILCGRAAWEYDYQEDEEGTTEIRRSGTKMKTDTELGYEPALLIEMEKVRTGSGQQGLGFTHRAWVIKDKFNQIMGKSFDFKGRNGQGYNPDIFKAFLPHIELLNIGGETLSIDPARTSEGLFQAPDSRVNIHKRREIAIENIQNEIIKKIPGRSTKDQQDKIKILEEVFKTASWTAISDMHPDRLETGLLEIKNKTMEENVNA